FEVTRSSCRSVQKHSSGPDFIRRFNSVLTFELSAARAVSRLSSNEMANQSKKSPVLIIGGGIGGLATALALAQKGIRVQLIEQAAEFKEIGAGIQLGPNVFRMFELLGLTEPVSRFAVFPENLSMLD